MKLRLLAIWLAIGLVVSTFAQQEEPRGGTTKGSSALNPIDQAALQAVVDAPAKELLVPGALVILSTPQGKFTVSYASSITPNQGRPYEAS
jgi:hypothetical protein